MKTTQSGKLRPDKPSGRQASEQPEHSAKDPASSTLHQGQGPDFPTQDSHVQNMNPAIGQIRRQPVERKKTGVKPQDPPETIQQRESDRKSQDD